ncbi:uncharacterized protein LY89DRAFT_776044 [Mollisia scopiformis]|uniref:2EXR domain-containing protein n=1 Tax=Mollisia scopiformis TaxID=149040 RepID=A0A194XUB7_MOLSC|nr:uncharacterized protein LY89DRAFT_776044 [Mollisia scopiformis]KUJ23803.1 hypothetical protein LY89DRAFT_776044 [Mollisia scopiformis]
MVTNEDEVNSVEASTSTFNEQSMSVEVFMRKAHQLADLARKAQVLAESLTAAMPEALHTGETYSQTSLSSALKSVQSAVPAVNAILRQSHKYCQFDRFTLFPKLPPELRLKIWKEAMPDSRVVPLWPKNDLRTDLSELAKGGESQVPKMLVHCPPPVILQVCRESRIEALKTFSWRPDTTSFISYHRADPAKDILYFVVAPDFREFGDFVHLFTPGALGKIKHLAFDSHFGLKHKLPEVVIKFFPNLETITIVMKCPDHSRPDHPFPEEIPEPRSLPTDVSLFCWDGPESITEFGKSAKMESYYSNNGGYPQIGSMRKAYKQHIIMKEKEGVYFDPPILKFCPVISGYECEQCTKADELYGSHYDYDSEDF